MFSSINFLFLLALGFTSWTILCYIQQIEQIQPNIRKPATVSMEIPVIINSSPKEAQHLANEPAQVNNKYDPYVNFLGVFVCIYILAKITVLAETFISKRIRSKIYIPTVFDYDAELPTDAFNELQECQKNLKWKLNDLQKENQEMKLKLEEVMQSKTPSSSHDMLADSEENIRNIIINNKHIHLTGQIYCNPDDTRQNTKMDRMKEFNVDSNSNIGVWEKYLQLQHQTTIENPITDVKDVDLNATMPVVMSSQELKSIGGIF